MHAYRDQYAQLFHDGRNVVLIAISVDAADTLAAWARDDEFPYLFASDSGSVIGKTYGAHNPKYGLDNRNLFVVGPDGKIAHVIAPSREIDPQLYKELAGRPPGTAPSRARSSRPAPPRTGCGCRARTWGCGRRTSCRSRSRCRSRTDRGTRRPGPMR